MKALKKSSSLLRELTPLVSREAEILAQSKSNLLITGSDDFYIALPLISRRVGRRANQYLLGESL